MKTLYVIKIGGNIIDHPQELNSFLSDFSRIREEKILVHGGGKTATEISRELGIEPQLVNGRRITDAATLRIITMVYAGLVNKNIVARLQACGCNAIGLTGADADTLPAKKRMPSGTDFGFAGDIDAVPASSLKNLLVLLHHRMTPVFAPVTHDRHGQLLNTNADTVAAALAAALSETCAVHLIYCFEKEGVLENQGDPDTLISKLSLRQYNGLKSRAAITGGMIPKLDNAFRSLRQGTDRAVICHAGDLLEVLSGKSKKGTELTPDIF